MSRRIVAETEIDGDTVRISAPAVGIAEDLPHDGDWLAAGARIGRFRSLNGSVELRLAEGVSGRVRKRCTEDREVAVEYRQLLFELQAMDALDSAELAAVAGAGAGETGSAEGRAIKAPTDGVFYRRPTPADPPFVAAGSRIHRGQTLGLIEVMKTFNQIAFEGQGLPDSAEVLEILVEDAQEVSAGQPLLRYRA